MSSFIEEYCCRLPTKLWEGNVFRRCYQSVCSRGGVSMWPLPMMLFTSPVATRSQHWWGISLWPLLLMHWASQYRDAPTPATSSPCRVPQSYLWSPFQASDIWWSRLETCSKLFTWGPPSCWWHLVAKTKDLFKPVYLRTPLVLRSDCWLLKYAWCILLECFLVYHGEKFM